MQHSLKREYAGRNESRTITPTCSCGWRGVGYAAYNDYQNTMVRAQEAYHIKQTKQADVIAASALGHNATGEKR